MLPGIALVWGTKTEQAEHQNDMNDQLSALGTGVTRQERLGVDQSTQNRGPSRSLIRVTLTHVTKGSLNQMSPTAWAYV
jgi:hypothetical protein